MRKTLLALFVLLMIAACSKQGTNTGNGVTQRLPEEIGTLAVVINPTTGAVCIYKSVIKNTYVVPQCAKSSGLITTFDLPYLGPVQLELDGVLTETGDGSYRLDIVAQNLDPEAGFRGLAFVATAVIGGSVSGNDATEESLPAFLAGDISPFGAAVASINLDPSSPDRAVITFTMTESRVRPHAECESEGDESPGGILVFNGSASRKSDGGVLSYQWSLTARPTGSASALSGTDQPETTCQADLPGTYSATLVVSESGIKSREATCNGHANPDPAPRAIVNAPPEAFVSQAVTVDGTQSFDPLGDPLSYSWSFIQKPKNSTATFGDVTAKTTQFVPDLPGNYVVRLTVSDGVHQVPATAVIQVKECEVPVCVPNYPPVLVLDLPELVETGINLLVSALDSSDPDGDPLAYSWKLLAAPAGSTASLNSATGGTSRFTPDLDGDYTVLLTVSDGHYTRSAVRTTRADMTTCGRVVAREYVYPDGISGVEVTNPVSVFYGSGLKVNPALITDPDNIPGNYALFPSQPFPDKMMISLRDACTPVPELHVSNFAITPTLEIITPVDGSHLVYGPWMTALPVDLSGLDPESPGLPVGLVRITGSPWDRDTTYSMLSFDDAFRWSTLTGLLGPENLIRYFVTQIDAGSTSVQITTPPDDGAGHHIVTAAAHDPLAIIINVTGSLGNDLDSFIAGYPYNGQTIHTYETRIHARRLDMDPTYGLFDAWNIVNECTWESICVYEQNGSVAQHWDTYVDQFFYPASIPGDTKVEAYFGPAFDNLNPQHCSPVYPFICDRIRLSGIGPDEVIRAVSP